MKRNYDVIPSIQRVTGCHGCRGCFTVGQTNQYPEIAKDGLQPREVCDSCLKKDKETGVYDAIMDIWNNYEEEN